MGRSEVKPEKIADQHKVYWHDASGKKERHASTGFRFEIEELGPKRIKEKGLGAECLGRYLLTDRRRPRKLIPPFKKVSHAKAEAEAIINKEAQLGPHILLRGKVHHDE